MYPFSLHWSTVVRYPDIAVFQPVINGVAGNLVGIQASRISTDLHRSSSLGQLPAGAASCNLVNPLMTFSPSCCSPVSSMMVSNATAALVLLLLVIPGHLVFNLAIGLSQGFRVLSIVFLSLYLLAALLQVTISVQGDTNKNTDLYYRLASCFTLPILLSLKCGLKASTQTIQPSHT